MKPDRVGEGKTMKFDALTMVTPAVVTEIGPDDALPGTVVTILVAFDVLTVAAMPLKLT